MKPYKITCQILHTVGCMLQFPLETIVQEILLCIHYNKPVKILLTLMHYRKILHAGMVLMPI